MDTVKDLAQIVYYIALSIAGPLALIEFVRARKRDRLANEYKIYDELDNRFFEYQKIALEYYDLDILDVPNNDPSLSFDKKRKQEMVAYAMLFSLFERAFLMFTHQAEDFQQRQWSGWTRFLSDFIRRESVRTAWLLSKSTYDTDFQRFMDEKIASLAPRTPPPQPLERSVVPQPGDAPAEASPLAPLSAPPVNGKPVPPATGAISQ